MFKYIYLKWRYTSLQKIIEIIAVFLLFLLNANLNPYLISLLVFMIIDVDFIKVLQENNFTKSYYFQTKEKTLIFLCNFGLYLLIMMLCTLFIQLDNKLYLSIYYSLTTAFIIQILMLIQTNKYNLIYCFIVLQTVALAIFKGVSYVI